jgi:hypothetical protein
MRHFVSPNFTHEKLEQQLYKDIVDVFEDRMRYWLLVPAKKLLRIKHGEIAAVSLATTYIEGIEIYISGEDSEGKSGRFFRRGYKRIFAPAAEQAYMQDAFADVLYKLLRCGFAHDAMFRSGIAFSNLRKEAITISWSRKNGRFDPKGHLGSAVINPRRFVECIELHFDSYMKELRARKESALKAPFLRAVDIKWRLGEPGPLVAMTEERFASGA